MAPYVSQEPSVSRESDAANSARSRGRILVVEDNPDQRETLTLLLQYEDYRVSVAANGQEALDLLHEGPLPDVILLDLMLPVMSGWEFRERQRSDLMLASIPTVALTGCIHRGEDAAVAGFVGYVLKPADIGELLAIIARYCRQA
jgi:CheY-like chemotaxis protein